MRNRALFVLVGLLFNGCDDASAPAPTDAAGPAVLDGALADPDMRAVDGGPAGGDLGLAPRDAARLVDGGLDAGPPLLGGAPVIEVIFAPTRFPDCDRDCNTQTLRFNVVDPEGEVDLVGGRLELLPEGAVLAELPAQTRRHEIGLSWRSFRDVAPIDFAEARADRQLQIVVADRAGNTTRLALPVTLVCSDGGPACGGRCAAGACFPAYRSCAAGRSCEYHPAPGGRDGGWTCDRTGVGRLEALCGPDAPCAVGFACHRRDTVGCEGFAGGDGCCTPRCQPGMNDCPADMQCQALESDRPCDALVGFCVYEGR